uniref:B30.2/SPRY domain-containing protein n=1 Tax=Clastoptera arizonana TaxID=38151 RepID=A0A1B6DMV2_9HEMI
MDVINFYFQKQNKIGMKSHSSYRYERVEFNDEILKYKSDPSSDKTVGVFIINRPLNPETCYFEVEVLNISSHSNIYVGLCTNRSPLDKHVGHSSGSLGIMTGDGRFYKDGAHIRLSCMTSGRCIVNDRFGVGIRFGYLVPSEDILYSNVHVFFTKNGEEICSYLARLPPGGLCPGVSMEDEGDELCIFSGLNWLPEEDTVMVVDSVEDDWYCLQDVRLNGQILEYMGPGETVLDVGLAQARNPLDTTSHYFEIEILEPGENCYIAIGLTEKDYPKNRLPGWNKGSIAYHADDGKVFIGSGIGEAFGPKCHKGDKMGCGILFHSYCDAKSQPDAVPDNREFIEDFSSEDENDPLDPSRTVEVFFYKKWQNDWSKTSKSPLWRIFTNSWDDEF